RRLLAYVRDGVTLHGMELVVTSCTVLTDEADRQVLRVTDRLLPTRAEFADGTTRALPVDRSTRRAIELTRIAGEWRIWSIRPAVSSYPSSASNSPLSSRSLIAVRNRAASAPSTIR